MKIILVETEGAGNIGSVARIMKNYGYKELFLLNPKNSINEESKKMACNAQDVLENTKIITELKESGANYFIGTSAIKGGEYNIIRNLTGLKELKKNEESAIVLGSESQGLSNELLENMDVVVSIPTSPEYPTLNISHALAIILYSLHDAEEDDSVLASIEQKELLTREFLNGIDKTSMNNHEIRTAELAFKKLIGRARITKREIQALFGSFKRL